jgi:uncharacterized membrane protein
MHNVYGLTLRTGIWVRLWLIFGIVLSFLHTAKTAFFVAEYRTVNTSLHFSEVKLSLCLTNQTLRHEELGGEWMYRSIYS